MAKGQVAKAEIANKIVELFGNDAFLYNDGKEVRINTQEDGELVQIKVALTAAKTPVTQGDEDALPGAVTTNNTATTSVKLETAWNAPEEEYKPVKATAEEKANVASLLEALGL